MLHVISDLGHDYISYYNLLLGAMILELINIMVIFVAYQKKKIILSLWKNFGT